MHRNQRTDVAESDSRQHQQAEQQRDHEHQIHVAAGQALIDHELQIQGAEQRARLHEQRQQQDQRHASRGAAGETHQIAQAQAARGRCVDGAAGRTQLDGDAGEMAVEFLEWVLSDPHGRIMDNHVTAAAFLQHDEMVEIPMQNRRSVQPFDIFEFEFQRAGLEPRRCRRPCQMFQRGAEGGQIAAFADRTDVGDASEMADDHRQAGQAAFVGLGLENHRQAAAPGEKSICHAIHQTRPRRDFSGLKTSPIRGASSVTTFAWNCMPASSACSSGPLTLCRSSTARTR